jgi:hypothetical protein
MQKSYLAIKIAERRRASARMYDEGGGDVPHPVDRIEYIPPHFKLLG